ncbi:MAG: endonuclease/exonuclease/phosphatase family protein [Halocynthiibacter sp.]
MRIATYNIEWFNSLFDDDGTLLNDAGWSGRRNVTRAEQIAALGQVFQAMDADGIMVIEAPDQGRKRDTVVALEHFADVFSLRARKAVMGFQNNTQQEIAFLYDPDVLSAVHDPMEDDNAPRFDGELPVDLDVDNTPEAITFSKPPLELSVETVGGDRLRLIGVHAKSKAPHGAHGRDEVIRMSIENRRKQLAQCVWLRRRVYQHLMDGARLMVMGDFNDGPGLDEYEKLFGHSSVEIVLGAGKQHRLYDPHAEMAMERTFGFQPTTSRFYITRKKRYLQALLDYIMVSEDIRETDPTWRIWHPLDDPDCFECTELRDALLTASDHFPVTVDVDL